MLLMYFLGVAGSASYTVFDTDYRNYAAIFTCQKLPLSHRQSVSVLSRTKTIDSSILEEVSALSFYLCFHLNWLMSLYIIFVVQPNSHIHGLAFCCWTRPINVWKK